MPSPSRRAPQLSRLFHANSRLSMPRPMPVTAHAARIAGSTFLNFPGRPRVSAERPREPDALDRLLDERSSTTPFGGRIDADRLIELLARSTRVNRASATDASLSSRRVYPSAGGLYPIETYVVPLQVSGLSASVYHWDVLEECLEELWPTHDLSLSALVPGLQPADDVPAALIVLTAIFARNEWKYGERGYRFSLMEAGALGQTLQLVAAAERLPCRWLGGFTDSACDALLRVNGLDEASLLLFGVG